jgi:hypothetical protein
MQFCNFAPDAIILTCTQKELSLSPIQSIYVIFHAQWRRVSMAKRNWIDDLSELLPKLESLFLRLFTFILFILAVIKIVCAEVRHF